jgi:hypothetical protein
MNRATSRKRFAPYFARRRQAWKKRMAGFEGLIFKAYDGNPDPLLQYLQRSGPLHLRDDHRKSLAWLLERKLPRNGRPKGSISPKTAATECASCLVHMGKAAWRKKHGRKRAPTKGPNKAPIKQLVSRAIELMENEFPKARGQISKDDVIDAANLKPSASVLECVFHDFFDARQEIIDIALK